MNKLRWLYITEYVSLICSVAGSAAAVALGQVMYATVPMSLSILLNLVNRYRFEQRTRHSTNTAITETYQQLSANIQSLHSSVLSLPAQVDLSSVQQALFKLTEKITAEQTKIQDHPARMSELDLKLLHEGLNKLANQYASLSESLAGVRKQLDALPSFVRFATLESTLAQLSTEIAAQNTKIENRLFLLESSNIEVIRSDILHIQEQCATLQDFLDSLVYRLLADKIIGSWLSSNEAESHMEKIVRQYIEQREQRHQNYDNRDIEAIFDLTQEDELEDYSWIDDEDDERHR